MLIINKYQDASFPSEMYSMPCQTTMLICLISLAVFGHRGFPDKVWNAMPMFLLQVWVGMALNHGMLAELDEVLFCQH
jgi:hypothetical protein